MIRRKPRPVVLYPIWLASTLYAIPGGLAIGCFFVSAFWFMIGYTIEWSQVFVVLGGASLWLLVIGGRALFRRHVRKQHPGVYVRFL